MGGTETLSAATPRKVRSDRKCDTLYPAWSRRRKPRVVRVVEIIAALINLDLANLTRAVCSSFEVGFFD